MCHCQVINADMLWLRLFLLVDMLSDLVVYSHYALFW
jgi:hypothetical protein